MASPAAILDVIVKANTAPAAAGLRRFDATLTKVDSTARRATTTTDHLETSNRNLGSSFITAAKYAAGAASAYVGISQAKAAVSTTTDLAKATLTLNKNLGLSVKTSSEFAAVAKARGVDTRALGQSFGTLSRQIEAAKNGSDTAVRSFKNLGITTAELKRQSPEQTITAVADGMEKLGAGTQRTAASMTLFGRGWQSVVPIIRDGSESMKEQLALADKYGASFSGKSVKSIEDLIASERELKIAQLGLQVQFTKYIAPALIDVFLKLAQLVNKFRTAKKDIEDFVGDVVAAFKNFWEKSEVLRSIVTKAFDAIKQNFKGLKEFIAGAVKLLSGILTGDFGKAWDGVKDIFQAGKDSILSVLRATTAPFRAVIEKLADIVTDVFGGAWRSVSNVVDNVVNSILGSVHHLTVEINKGFKAIFKYTNAALSSLGVKPVAFSLATAVAEGAAQGHQKGGVIHAARGRMVPGRGSGDKVPAMLEPGEVVLNRNAVRAMGGARKANRINRMIPRFAKGGEATSAMGAMMAEAQRFEDQHFPYVYGGGHGGFGIQPVDCSGAVSDVLHAGGLLQGAPMVSGALMNWGKPGRGPLTVYASPAHTVMSLNGRFFGTSGSNPGGGAGWIEGGSAGLVPGGVARTMDVAGAVAKQVARVILNGPDGPLKAMGQAALDKVHSAANTYISKHMPAGSFGGGDAQIPGVTGGFDKVWSKVNPDLGKWKRLMGEIVSVESGGDPHAGGPGTSNPTHAGWFQYDAPTWAGDAPAGAPGWPTGPYNAALASAGAGNAIRSDGMAGVMQRWTNWDGVVPALASGGIVGKMSNIASSGASMQHFAGGGTAKKPPKFHPPKSALAPNDIASAWQNVTSGGGPSTYHPTPSAYTPGPSIALQFAQLDVAMANAATTMDVADDRAVLDQRALLVNSQIAKVTSQLSKKGLSAARRLALTQKLADLKGQLNSIASDQQALYPKPDFIGGDQTVYDTSAQDAAAQQAADDLAAQKALTEAIAALTAEMAAQNALINSTTQSDYASALAYIGDLLSGSIGGQVAPRFSTAGSGSVVRA